MRHLEQADMPHHTYTIILTYLHWPSPKILGHWAHLNQKKTVSGSRYWGWTVLHVCAAFGIYNLAVAALDAEISAQRFWDVGDAAGRTPLSLAAEIGNSDLVKLFCLAGADINTRDLRYGFLPLHWFSSSGYISAVKQLLQHGADADINDSLQRASSCCGCGTCWCCGSSATAWSSSESSWSKEAGWTMARLKCESCFSNFLWLTVS